MKWLGRVSVLAALLAAGGALALEVKGVKLEERIVLTPPGAELVLNGAGVRKKFFVSVYVGALYLPRKSIDASAILGAEQPNRVAMHFLYDKVEAEKLTDGWRDGFEGNLDAAGLAAVTDRLGQFNALFSDVAKGDVILFDYLPGTGTRVTIRGEIKGTVPGADFNRALLKVWLGEKPASGSLKEAMLGQ